MEFSLVMLKAKLTPSSVSSSENYPEFNLIKYQYKQLHTNCALKPQNDADGTTAKTCNDI